MRKYLIIIALLLSAKLGAQELINDYTLVGVNYGVTFSNMYYNPSKHNRLFIFNPHYASITFTKYSKMFDSLPYFGVEVGVATGSEGFGFKPDKLTGKSNDLDGATWGSMRVFEIPAMAQIHIDAEPVKIMAKVGVYGGWRQSITRTGPYLDQAYANSFRPYENQIEYGLQGGAGLALMFDPIEIHFNGLLRWSWSSLYEPNYASEVYYRFAYPMDIMVTVGIHYQLTKRRGKTRAMLRKEAYDIVYGTSQNPESQDRK